jgi:Lon protease-like protein
MPMFPLGTVLVPSMVLPLHVFEERYRQLVDDCLAGSREFGVVLIERGSEVGGGDVRTMTGTVAEIVQAEQFDDGRWALGCIGTRRIKVTEWLADDPYPRAAVTTWDEPSAPDDLDDRIAQALRGIRQALAWRAELGEPAAPATIDVTTDPVLASYQLIVVGPFGPADRQRLLELPDASSRVDEIDRLIHEELTFLRLRLEQ